MCTMYKSKAKLKYNIAHANTEWNSIERLKISNIKTFFVLVWL